MKVYDNERLEPPHLTLICREKVWRIGLRDREFIVPPGGRWKDIDPEVKALLEDEKKWRLLQDAWDKKHPTNAVLSKD